MQIYSNNYFGKIFINTDRSWSIPALIPEQIAPQITHVINIIHVLKKDSKNVGFFNELFLFFFIIQSPISIIDAKIFFALSYVCYD